MAAARPAFDIQRRNLSIIMSTIIVKPAVSDLSKQVVAAIERQVFDDGPGGVLSGDPNEIRL
jgi:hypothetical protein